MHNHFQNLETLLASTYVWWKPMEGWKVLIDNSGILMEPGIVFHEHKLFYFNSNGWTFVNMTFLTFLEAEITVWGLKRKQTLLGNWWATCICLPPKTLQRLSLKFCRALSNLPWPCRGQHTSFVELQLTSPDPVEVSTLASWSFNLPPLTL